MFNPIELGKAPLERDHAEKPGAYKLASKLRENNLNAGDVLHLEQYITGYGANSDFKIICYISSSVFDKTESKLTSGFYKDGEKWHWGDKTISVNNEGFSLTPGRMQNPQWKEPALIFDTRKDTNYIITEKNLPLAPFTYSLKILKDAKPGNHYIVFYMTYFNGIQWICEEERVDFKINNTFERYNTAISALAATAMIVTILHDGVSPFLEILHSLAKFIAALRSK